MDKPIWISIVPRINKWRNEKGVLGNVYYKYIYIEVAFLYINREELSIRIIYLFPKQNYYYFRVVSRDEYPSNVGQIKVETFITEQDAQKIWRSESSITQSQYGNGREIGDRLSISFGPTFPSVDTFKFGAPYERVPNE